MYEKTIVKRRFADVYRGFTIFKEEVYRVTKFSFSSYTEKEDDYFVFAKGGNELLNKTSLHYYIAPRNIETAKAYIDNILDKGVIYLTNGQAQKWVYGPNKKNEWGFSKEDLIKIVKAYKRCKNPYRKVGYTERLTDANFHTFCSYLDEEDFNGAMEWIEKEM